LPTLVHNNPSSFHTYKLPLTIYESPILPVGCAIYKSSSVLKLPKIVTPVPSFPGSPFSPFSPLRFAEDVPLADVMVKVVSFQKWAIDVPVSPFSPLSPLSPFSPWIP
jgi:hypothetical protein